MLFQQVKLMCLGILQLAEMEHRLHIIYTDVPALGVLQINISIGVIQRIIKTQVLHVIQLMDIEFEHMIVLQHFLVILILLMQPLFPANPKPTPLAHTLERVEIFLQLHS